MSHDIAFGGGRSAPLTAVSQRSALCGYYCSIRPRKPPRPDRKRVELASHRIFPRSLLTVDAPLEIITATTDTIPKGVKTRNHFDLRMAYSE